MPANGELAVHIAPSYAGLLRAAATWMHGRPPEILVLAPSKGAADDFLRSIGAGLMGVHVFTLTQFAAALASSGIGAAALTPMSQLSLEALIARVIHEERKREPLGYFEPVAGMPGFVHALATTLGELRMEAADAGALSSSGEPGRDLARLMGAFGYQLAKQALADRAIKIGRAHV